MKRFAVLLATVFILGGLGTLSACSPEPDTTGAISNCVRDLFPSYNPKIMDQCVNACKKCDRGTTTTCTTSCTLKGAR
ncbi:hypothetical protein [Bradyrhizobium sp. dw_411]|uniref:hypothetical protein n=1 Tax=Bradyrhizobium sp. dw_411 TaxID=2720082 RepID=UPI001BCC6AD6|nr:hypothetical protein [Bradyrhizobium sp. dw_411]